MGTTELENSLKRGVTGLGNYQTPFLPLPATSVHKKLTTCCCRKFSVLLSSLEMAIDTTTTKTQSPMLGPTLRPLLSARLVTGPFLCLTNGWHMSYQVQSHILGSLLRSTYFDSKSTSYIEGIRSDLVDNNEVKVRVKAGAEGTVIFDSAIALLQGLFPPTPNNKIVLANETIVTAPLGGYQYVPGKFWMLFYLYVYKFLFCACAVETVEPGNDRSLESWTNCPVRRNWFLICVSGFNWTSFNLDLWETYQRLLQFCWFQGQGSRSSTFLQSYKRLRLRSPHYFGEHC